MKRRSETDGLSHPLCRKLERRGVSRAYVYLHSYSRLGIGLASNKEYGTNERKGYAMVEVVGRDHKGRHTTKRTEI